MAIIDFLKEYYFVVLVVCVMLSYLFGYYLGEGLQKANEEKRLQEEARDLKKQLAVQTLKLSLLLAEPHQEGSLWDFAKKVHSSAVSAANPRSTFSAALYIEETTKVNITLEQIKEYFGQLMFTAITGHL